MLNYKVREIFGGDDGKTFFCISFDFDEGHEALSEFLGGDSELIFGHDFERFDEIMKEDHYESAGNAYTIEIAPDNVTVTLQFDMDEERSECISREDFVWVMNEWARECRRVKKEYGERPCKRPKNLFERLLDRRFFVRKGEKSRRQGKNEI